MPSNPHRVTTINEVGLLSLLQISDSFFPTGAFTQSYGLETYVQEERVHSRETLVEFLTVYLLEALATSDCLALALAYRAAERVDLEEIQQLDQILTAQKVVRESRQASLKTGSRMLRVINQLYSIPLMLEFSRLIRDGKAHGNHAMVFGLAGQGLGIGLKEVALAYVYNATSGIVNSAVRLVPLGQNDGQWVLMSLQKTMQETVDVSLELTLEDLGASTPALEIRAMQHERLYSRLFMS
jgi:urease accessory protein